ncbi:hypothetical protein [Nocardia asiatica]|uniref:hypothetical protein n=1 Tax=Nocardia asiatica TaxID=209252 RepID=UPI0024544810|nr:hypothetical protein [Nocardia asiatica]
MSALANWIKAQLKGEPLATRVGPALLLIVGYLVTRGVIDDDLGQLIAAVVTLLLGGGALAAARALVTPMSKLYSDEHRGVDPALPFIRYREDDEGHGG